MKLIKNIFLQYLFFSIIAFFISCFFIINPVFAETVTIKVQSPNGKPAPGVQVAIQKINPAYSDPNTWDKYDEPNWQEPEQFIGEKIVATTNDKGVATFNNIGNGEYQVFEPINIASSRITVPQNKSIIITRSVSGRVNPECVNTIFGVICGEDALKNFIKAALDWVTAIIGAAAALMIIYAGFIYMTSGGNEEKIGQAKQIIFSALAGLALIILAQVIFRTLGVSWL